jgi:glycosyltransferase involved in cell wall biosynthesis
MSDSQAIDMPRKWWIEAVKRRVVGGFSAGLVAGSPHVAYLASLGMPRERICTGYDVVDNEFFAQGAHRARQFAAKTRDRLGLPERYFLASNRFLPKKNLLTLLRAYAGYRAAAGKDRWKLVLLGDGPMKDQLLALRKQLDLEADVQLPGFKQYHDLPAYYALAGTFVHASTSDQWGLVVNEAMAAGLPVLVSERCGCAPDLVAPGRNGFRFDPGDEPKLTGHLRKIAGGEYDLAAMAEASRAIIRAWSPQTFAVNLWKAAELALGAPRRSNWLVDRLLLRALIHRREFD